jgi:hypothetical protein
LRAIDIVVVDPVLKVPSVHVSYIDFVRIYSATSVQYGDDFINHRRIHGHGERKGES